MPYSYNKIRTSQTHVMTDGAVTDESNHITTKCPFQIMFCAP